MGSRKDIFSLLSMSVLFLNFFLLRIILFFLKIKGGKLLYDFMYSKDVCVHTEHVIGRCPEG